MRENAISTHATGHHPTQILAIPPRLLSAPGPVVSVYLTTESAVPQAAERVALRWKTMRRTLDQDGAPATALAAVDALIDGSYAAGETLVAVTNAAGLLYAAHLPGMTDRETAVVSPVAHLIPLLQATQSMVPYLVVATDRLGADLVAVLPDQPEIRAQVEGDDDDITRAAPRGRSQARFQQRAESSWEANAGDVADALVRMFDETKPRVVIVSGDIRAVQLLHKQLPRRVTDVLSEVQGDYSNLDEALRRSGEFVAAAAAVDTAAILSDWDRGRPRGLAVSGPDATLAALYAGQVSVLLVDPTRTQGQSAWFGTDPRQAAATADVLQSDQVPDLQSAPLADVAVRAALAGDAQVRILPAGTAELAPSGIGALLRYA